MATFHVYVEGPVEQSPEGIGKLATAISKTYGLPVADLVSRMTKGRFRVKANIDRATAETYVRALEHAGARVTIEEAHPTQPVPVTRPDPSAAAPPVTRPDPSAAAPLVSSAPPSSSLPPANAARPSSPVLPPSTGSKAKAAPMQSGLSAAFSGDLSATNLGALDGLSLASLDGSSDHVAPAGTFEPTPEIARPIAGTPAAPAAAAAKPPKGKDVPLDLFAPPSEGAELKVDLADDELEDRARKSQRSLPAPAPELPPAPASKPMSPPPVRSTPASEPSIQGTRASGHLVRGRFALGVFLSICLGFVPAHAVASWRERSAFKAIDAQVEATQIASDTPEMYAALDAFREAQLARKQSERRNIALIAILLWAGAGAGVAFVWFRKIPWNRQDA